MKTTALQVAVLKVLADAITERITVLKEDVKGTFADTGADRTVAELPDGTRAATVSLDGAGRQSASVTDPGALLDWVTAHHPDETETVIRGSYLEKLLDTAKAEGRAIDPLTGELVPGITVKDRTPFISVRFKPGGREAIIAAWRAGQLTGIDLVAPEAIEASDAA